MLDEDDDEIEEKELELIILKIDGNWYLDPMSFGSLMY